MITLIVEDGSGVSGALSYISVADATTHHTYRGNTRWNDFSPTQQLTAVVRATDYIDKRFGRHFRGIRRSSIQSLQWPRLNAFDDSGFVFGADGKLPIKLIRATAEYALRAAIVQVLAPDPLKIAPSGDMTTGATPVDPDTVPGIVGRKTVRVGPIESTIQYQSAAQIAAARSGTRAVQSTIVDDMFIPEYPEADMWIEELLNNANASATLIRGD